jgi:hypothetical protein
VAARRRPWRTLRRPPGDVGGKLLGFETGGEQCGGPAHHLAQLDFAQRRHVDQAMHGIERLVFLQVTEEVGPHADHRTQARVTEVMSQDFREAPALAFSGAHEKLFSWSM